MLALWLALAASAQNVESWELLHDSLLLEAADHDLELAISRYEELVRNLGPDDPVHSEALYWLGRARHERGDNDGARDALRECVRLGTVKARCLEQLGRLELEESSVRRVPVLWTFDDTAHGVLHPWEYADRGSIRVATGVLEWTTEVDARSDDRLVVGFDRPEPVPRGVRFEARSADRDAWLRVLVFDIYGRKYSGAERGVLHITRGEQVVVELWIGTLVGDDAELGSVDPAELDRLVIQDVTAFYAGDTGRNTLLIDDFEVF